MQNEMENSDSSFILHPSSFPNNSKLKAQNSKLTIAHLARTCYPFHAYGGLERHVYHLTLELARLGHSVRLFTRPPDIDKADLKDVWPENVQHHFVPYNRIGRLRLNSIPDRLTAYPPFIARLGKAVGQMSPPPDIVHAHGLTGASWGKGSGLLVLNPHGMEEFKAGSRAKQVSYAPFRAILRRAAKKAAAVIATDIALVPEVEKYLHVPTDRIALVANAVDLEAIGVVVARVGRPDELQMLSVGRLEHNKGFDVLLNALGQIKNDLPRNWRWTVVGTGSQLASLQSLASQHGIGERVTFAGGLDDAALKILYQKADLFVHPTRYEGSSLVTLEAMAYGLPVVASRTGGLPDKVFEDGPYQNGTLVSPDNPTELATALLSFSRLPQAQRQELGQQGRQLVQDRFSWTAAGRATQELYYRLLAN